MYAASHVALVVKNPPANAGEVRDLGLSLIPRLGRSLGEGNGNPFQYCCWRIPWTEEPGGLQCMGLQRVEHDWSDLAHFLYNIGWSRKKWLTAVYLVYQRKHIVMVSNQIWVFPLQIQGWGRHVNPRPFHFNVWQNSLQKKKKKSAWKSSFIRKKKKSLCN